MRWIHINCPQCGQFNLWTSTLKMTAEEWRATECIKGHKYLKIDDIAVVMGEMMTAEEVMDAQVRKD